MTAAGSHKPVGAEEEPEELAELVGAEEGSVELAEPVGAEEEPAELSSR